MPPCMVCHHELSFHSDASCVAELQAELAQLRALVLAVLQQPYWREFVSRDGNLTEIAIKLSSAQAQQLLQLSFPDLVRFHTEYGEPFNSSPRPALYPLGTSVNGGSKMPDRIVGQFTPVFIRDGNRVVITLPEFLAVDEVHAADIGCGARLVEGIIFGLQYGGETLCIPPAIKHVYGKMVAGQSVLPVAILSGPLYDRYAGDESVVGEHP